MIGEGVFPNISLDIARIQTPEYTRLLKIARDILNTRNVERPNSAISAHGMLSGDKVNQVIIRLASKVNRNTFNTYPFN